MTTFMKLLASMTHETIGLAWAESHYFKLTLENFIQ